MEKPSTSTFARPSAPLKAMALLAIPSIEVGTCPELLEMPALLNRMTSRGYGQQRHRLQRRAGSCESRRAGFLHRGFRAQEIAGQAPGLVRKLVLVGTG